MSSLSEVITNTLSAIGAPLLTDLMLVLLLAVFAAAVALRLRNQAHAFTNYVPTLLTIIGLLGTFSGILVGLLEFNIQRIDGSIGALLAGLKTAFIASLTGIVLSIIYKTLISTELLKPLPRFQGSGDQISAEEHVQDVLQAQLTMHNKHHHVAQQQLQALLHLNERINGFEARLDQRLTQLAQQVSITATQQITSALENVVGNFNDTINHQFGEQFGNLNHAVGALVTWQSEHKHQLVAMQEQYQLGIKQLSLLQTTLQQAHHFWQDSLTGFEQVPNHLNQLITQLSAVIGINQQQIQQLNTQLTYLADVHDQALSAVPSINTLMATHIDHLQHSTQKVMTGLQQASQHIEQNLADMAHGFEQIKHSANNQLETQLLETQTLMQSLLQKQLVAIDDAMHVQIEHIMTELSRATQQMTKPLRQELTHTNSITNQTSVPPVANVPGVVTDLTQVPLSAHAKAVRNQHHVRDKHR